MPPANKVVQGTGRNAVRTCRSPCPSPNGDRWAPSRLLGRGRGRSCSCRWARLDGVPVGSFGQRRRGQRVCVAEVLERPQGLPLLQWAQGSVCQA